MIKNVKWIFYGQWHLEKVIEVLLQSINNFERSSHPCGAAFVARGTTSNTTVPASSFGLKAG